jgi:hypothetical protein
LAFPESCAPSSVCVVHLSSAVHRARYGASIARDYYLRVNESVDSDFAPVGVGRGGGGELAIIEDNDEREEWERKN